MSYAEIVKLAVDTIKNKKDFYIDSLSLSRPARLHLFVSNIGGRDWYTVSAKIFNGNEYVKGRSCSASDLDELKHAVGVCWHYVQNNSKEPLSDQIQSAVNRTAEVHSADKAPGKELVTERS